MLKAEISSDGSKWESVYENSAGKGCLESGN